VKLAQSVVWDQIRSAYLGTREAGSENVSETINLLTDAKPVRVFMAQTHPPLADRNGRDCAAQDGRRGNIDEMSGAQAKQELVEVRNTIDQQRKNRAPFKRQRREGWNNSSDNWNDSHHHHHASLLKFLTQQVSGICFGVWRFAPHSLPPSLSRPVPSTFICLLNAIAWLRSASRSPPDTVS
jgi:hypothetical protein